MRVAVTFIVKSPVSDHALFDKVVLDKASDAFDLLFDRIPFTDLSVDLASVGSLAFRFHLPCDNAFVDSRNLISSLPCIASVIDLLVFIEIPVTVFRPRCSPDLSLAVIVPVVLRNRDLLPEIFRSLALTDSDFLLAVFVQLRNAVLGSFFFPFGIVGRFCRVIYRPAFFISLVCEDCLLFLLPLLMFIYPSKRLQDVCMRVAVTFIVKSPVSDHALFDKVVPDEASDAFDLLFTCHFVW